METIAIEPITAIIPVQFPTRAEVQTLEKPADRVLRLYFTAADLSKNRRYEESNAILTSIMDPAVPFPLECFNALAHNYRRLNKPLDALREYQNVLRYNDIIGPQREALNFFNMAAIFADLGQPADAIRCASEAYRMTKSANAMWSTCVGYFLAEEMELGWECFKHRKLLKAYESDDKGENADIPLWNGEVGTPERPILIYGEQGAGERFLWASLLEEAAERFGTIYVLTPERYLSLYRRSFTKARIIAFSDRLDVRPAYRGLMADFGPYLRPTLDSFPRTPFMKVDETKRARLRETFGPGPIVGLSWKSNNGDFGHMKSIKLADYAPILNIPAVRFVNLQYGAVEAEIAEAEAALGVSIARPAIDIENNLDSLAALTAACDLVLTTSNITVHIAGAVGTPTWALIPEGYGRIWYWFLNREDSPFYGSVRLFRGGWEHGFAPAIERMTLAFGEWLNGGNDGQRSELSG